MLRLDQGLGRPLRWASPLGEDSLPQLLRQGLVRAELPPGPGWIALVWAAVAAVLVLAAVGALRLGERGRLLAWLALGPPAIGLAVAAFGPNVVAADRWYATSAAALLGLAAVGVAGVAGGGDGRERTAPGSAARGWRRAVGAALLVALSAAGCAAVLRVPQGRADWRQMARILDRRLLPGEEVALLVDTPWRRSNLAYYWPGPVRLLGEGAGVPAGVGGVWVGTTRDRLDVTPGGPGGRPSAAARELAAIRRRFPRREAFAIGAGQLVHFSLPPPSAGGEEGTGRRPGGP
jgi:hypothetical protein